MKSYLNLLQHIMDTGRDRSDRTGVGTRSIFGTQWEHDMREGFPLLTTKKVHFKSVAVELLWFMRGDTNVRYLQDRGVTIWNEWAQADGNLGPVYGKQWRDFNGVDQLLKLIEDIEKTPDSRRLIVSAWNPVDVPKMKLPPCHTLWQVYCEDDTLSLHLYARSIDAFLGLPFNIASYALLLSVLCRITDRKPARLVISFGDLHIYKNHFEQVETQLMRDERELPLLSINEKLQSFADFVTYAQHADFALVNYNPHPAIAAPIAV